jgi:hypothetical protein
MTEIIRVNDFLRIVLLADAATCFACGLLLIAGRSFLPDLLGLPSDLMSYVGASLFPFAAFLVYAATRKSISKTMIWIVIGLNLLWTIDSFLLLLTGYVSPTTLGYIFIVFQAIGVLLFADLEFIGMRKAAVVVLKDARETI